MLTEPVELFEVELGQVASKHQSCREGFHKITANQTLHDSLAFRPKADVNDIPARAQYSFPGIAAGTCNMVLWQGAEIWAVLEVGDGTAITPRT